MGETEERTLGWCLWYSETEAGVSVLSEGHIQGGSHTLSVLHDFSYRKARDKKEKEWVPPSLIASHLTILP